MTLQTRSTREAYLASGATSPSSVSTHGDTFFVFFPVSRTCPDWCVLVPLSRFFQLHISVHTTLLSVWFSRREVSVVVPSLGEGRVGVHTEVEVLGS